MRSNEATPTRSWRLHLGGAIRQRVRAYGTGCYYPPDYADRPVMLDKLREEVLRIRATGVAAARAHSAGRWVPCVSDCTAAAGGGAEL